MNRSVAKRRVDSGNRIMKKIISLFQRNIDTDRLVRNEIVPGAEWVIEGSGVATRKFDGTCCLVRDGKLYRRYDAKKGRRPPAGFEPAQAPDFKTGHWPGWLPVTDTPQDKYHWEAFHGKQFDNGTYELCGPKIHGNPEKLSELVLVRHGADFLPDCPRDFDGLKDYFQVQDIEGVVWHHNDGRMVKIKGKDFGIRREWVDG